MAKSANAGQLNTPVYIQSRTPETNSNGFTGQAWAKVFDTPVMCYWANAYGTEFFEAARNNLVEPATITMRYSPLVNLGQRVIRVMDTQNGNIPENPIAFEIIGVNNVEMQNAWLELKIARVVAV